MVYLFYTHMANAVSTVIVQCAVNTNCLFLWKMQSEILSLLLILFTMTCNEDCIIVVF